MIFKINNKTNSFEILLTLPGLPKRINNCLVHIKQLNHEIHREETTAS